MNKRLFSLLLLGVAMIATPAHAAEKESYKSEATVESSASGDFKAKQVEQNTDATGTLVKKEITKEVDVDSNGNKETTVKTSTTTDPEGLMNKETVRTEEKESVKDGKVESTHKKTVNGKVVEEKTDKKP